MTNTCTLARSGKIVTPDAPFTALDPSKPRGLRPSNEGRTRAAFDPLGWVRGTDGVTRRTALGSIKSSCCEVFMFVSVPRTAEVPQLVANSFFFFQFLKQEKGFGKEVLSRTHVVLILPLSLRPSQKYLEERVNLSPSKDALPPVSPKKRTHQGLNQLQNASTIFYAVIFLMRNLQVVPTGGRKTCPEFEG